MRVFLGSTPTFRAVCTEKEQTEAKPGQVRIPKGMCQYNQTLALK